MISLPNWFHDNLYLLPCQRTPKRLLHCIFDLEIYTRLKTHTYSLPSYPHKTRSFLISITISTILSITTSQTLLHQVLQIPSLHVPLFNSTFQIYYFLVTLLSYLQVNKISVVLNINFRRKKERSVQPVETNNQSINNQTSSIRRYRSGRTYTYVQSPCTTKKQHIFPVFRCKVTIH